MQLHFHNYRIRGRRLEQLHRGYFRLGSHGLGRNWLLDSALCGDFSPETGDQNLHIWQAKGGIHWRIVQLLYNLDVDSLFAVRVGFEVSG